MTKKILKLINNENLKAKITSAKACESDSYDHCVDPDYAVCAINALDNCAKDYAACYDGAIDVCYVKDYAGCVGEQSDYCTTDTSVN